MNAYILHNDLIKVYGVYYILTLYAFMLLQSSKRTPSLAITVHFYLYIIYPISNFHFWSFILIYLTKSTLASASRDIINVVISATSYFGVVGYCLGTLALWAMQTIFDVARIKDTDVGLWRDHWSLRTSQLTRVK